MSSRFSAPAVDQVVIALTLAPWPRLPNQLGPDETRANRHHNLLVAKVHRTITSSDLGRAAYGCFPLRLYISTAQPLDAPAAMAIKRLTMETGLPHHQTSAHDSPQVVYFAAEIIWLRRVGQVRSRKPCPVRKSEWTVITDRHHSLHVLSCGKAVGVQDRTGGAPIAVARLAAATRVDQQSIAYVTYHGMVGVPKYDHV